MNDFATKLLEQHRNNEGDGPLDHAREWELLAKEHETMGGAGPNRAETYRRTAESFRLEAKTGVAHCSCCLKPLATAHRI